MSCVSDEVGHVTVFFVFQHLEGFAEAEISHHVEGQVIAPVGHVLSDAPFFRVSEFLQGLGTESGAECSYIGEDVLLHALDGMV